jgi:hypothetical protein
MLANTFRAKHTTPLRIGLLSRLATHRATIHRDETRTTGNEKRKEGLQCMQKPSSRDAAVSAGDAERLPLRIVGGLCRMTKLVLAAPVPGRIVDIE